MNQSADLGIITTGGTVAMVVDEDTGTPSPSLSGAELIEGLVKTDGEINCLDLYQIASEDVTFDHWCRLAVETEKFINQYGNVLILHGTDTIAEGAFFLAEVLNNPTVIMTGAIRARGSLGEDGRRNIKDAATAALSGLDLGVSLAIGGQLLPAWSASKTDTVALESFTSRVGATLGRVHDGQVQLASAPLDANWIGQIPERIDASNIGLITLAADSSVKQIEAVIEASEAVVIQALATGLIPQVAYPAIAEAAKQIPVVLTSRLASGPVEESEAYPGIWRQLRQEGVIIENNLDGYKARIRLAISQSLNRNYQPFIVRLK